MLVQGNRQAEKLPKELEMDHKVSLSVDLKAVDTSHLPKLTEKQYAFVVHIALGYDVTTAYTKAYSTAGKTVKDKYVQLAAWKQAHHKKIQAWLNRIRQYQLNNALSTLEDHMNELKNIRELAKEAGKWNVALHAEKLRGQASGHYNHTQTVVVGEIRELYAEIAKHSAKQPLAMTFDGEYEQVAEQTAKDADTNSKSELALDFDDTELRDLEEKCAAEGLDVEEFL